MSDSRNLFLSSQRKMARKIRGGGRIYWTYSLLVPKNRHRELALKKVRILSERIHYTTPTKGHVNLGFAGEV